MTSQEAYYATAFARNRGLISEREQEKLRASRVAIAGLGGVGGGYLVSLVRTGIGRFRIADFDSFELANINRQVGATSTTVGESKVAVMAAMARDINPFVALNTFPQGISEETIDAFLEGVSVVLDGLDFFNLKDRLLLFERARAHRIPAITAAPIGFGASLLAFSPEGMSFQEYFDIRPSMSEEEQLVAFGLGLSPSLIHTRYFKPERIDLAHKATPSLGMGTVLCANMVSCEVVKILLGKPVRYAPFSTQFDPYLQQYRKVFLRSGNRNFGQRVKRWFISRKLQKLVHDIPPQLAPHEH